MGWRRRDAEPTLRGVLPDPALKPANECKVVPPMMVAATPVLAVTKVPFSGSAPRICFRRYDLPVPALPVKKMLPPLIACSNTFRCSRERDSRYLCLQSGIQGHPRSIIVSQRRTRSVRDPSGISKGLWRCWEPGGGRGGCDGESRPQQQTPA